MADNTRKEDNRDRSRVSGSEDYEVEYFARENGISAEQARSEEINMVLLIVPSRR